MRTRRDHGTIDRDRTFLEQIARRVERAGIRTMPAAPVIAERPTETSDAPTFSARFAQKLLAEAQIADTLDIDLFGRRVRQFILSRHVVTRNVPAIGTTPLPFLLHRSRTRSFDHNKQQADANNYERQQHSLLINHSGRFQARAFS